MESEIFEELVNIFELPKIGLFISGIFLYAYRKITFFYEYKKKRKIETLQRIVDFFQKFDGERKKFLTEQLIYNHFNALLSYNEIVFFLESKKPSVFLLQFIAAQQFLEFNQSSGQVVVKRGINLDRERWKGAAWYVVCGVPGVMMLLGAWSAYIEYGPKIYAYWIIMTIALLLLAWLGLGSGTKSSTAKKLLSDFEGAA